MADRTEASGSSHTSMPSMRTAPSGVGRRRARSIASVVLPDPVRPTMASDSPGRHLEAHVVEHLARPVRERQVLDAERAPDVLRRAARTVDHLGRRVENVAQAGEAGAAALHDAQREPDGDHRPRHARERAPEGEERPLREAAHARGPRRSNDEPYQKKTRTPIAATAPIVGPNEPRSRASARLAFRYSRFVCSKRARSRSSSAKLRTTRTPARFAWSTIAHAPERGLVLAHPVEHARAKERAR